MPVTPLHWAAMSARQRTEVSDSDFATLLQLVRMEAGIAPFPPEVRPELPAPPKPPSTTMFTVTIGYNSSSLLFDTAQDAATVAALVRGRQSYEWPLTQFHVIARESPVKVEPVDIHSDEAIRQAKAAHVAHKEHCEARQKDLKAVEAYDAQIEAAIRPITDQRAEAESVKWLCQRISATFAKYRELAEGNDEVARRFLEKAYSAHIDLIDTSLEWFPLDQPAPALA